MQGDLRDDAVDILGTHHDPVADLDQVVDIDLHTGDKGKDRLLKKQQQYRRDRAQAGKQIDGAFPDQHRNEDNDPCRPHETDGDPEQTVDRPLLRIVLLFVPQPKTLDAVGHRQCQKGDQRSRQRLVDQDRDPLVQSVAPDQISNENHRQT